MRQTIASFSFVLLLFLPSTNIAQNTPQPIYLNHIFFVMDSNAYAHVFDSTIFKKLAFSMVNKTTTTEGSWYGKYLLGRDSYFEVFYPTGLKGSSVDNFGFGFMTTTSGDIDYIETQWKSEHKDSVKRDTSVEVNNGHSQPWFYSIALYTVDSSKSGSAWVMENTPSILKSSGFSDSAIKKPILWHEFMGKRMKNTKSFNKIIAVEFITNKKELDYFKKSFLGFGLTQKHHTFYNENVKITYTIKDIPTSKLKSVEIELTDAYNEQTLILSNKLSMYIKDKYATFLFAD